MRKKLEERQFKPFEFVKTVPAYNPSQRIFDPIPGKFNALDKDYYLNITYNCFILWNCVEIPQNPQTLSLLELLGLPYLLDSSPVTGERTAIPASPARTGNDCVLHIHLLLHQPPMTDAMCIADFQTYSEEIPIDDDTDEIEDIPEAEGDNIPH